MSRVQPFPLLPWLLLVALIGNPIAVRSEVVAGIDRETGLRSWTWRVNGVHVQLVQRLPDQTRAFFLARGFSAQAAEVIGRACVFQTIFRNDGETPVAYDLDTWVVHLRDTRLPLLVRESWESRWRAMGLEQAALIAARWSLLPTRQRFEPGDYNWGMTSFGLEPGEYFDLTLSIELGGQPVLARIPSVECAPDRQ